MIKLWTFELQDSKAVCHATQAEIYFMQLANVFNEHP